MGLFLSITYQFPSLFQRKPQSIKFGRNNSVHNFRMLRILHLGELFFLTNQTLADADLQPKQKLHYSKSLTLRKFLTRSGS